MATFYGQVEGRARTVASREGSDASRIKASVQSWDGSIITELYYQKQHPNNLYIKVSYDNGSSFYGHRVWEGSVSDFVAMCNMDMSDRR